MVQSTDRQSRRSGRLTPIQTTGVPEAKGPYPVGPVATTKPVLVPISGGEEAGRLSPPLSRLTATPTPTTPPVKSEQQSVRSPLKSVPLKPTIKLPSPPKSSLAATGRDALKGATTALPAIRDGIKAAVLRPTSAAVPSVVVPIVPPATRQPSTSDPLKPTAGKTERLIDENRLTPRPYLRLSDL